MRRLFLMTSKQRILKLTNRRKQRRLSYQKIFKLTKRLEIQNHALETDDVILQTTESSQPFYNTKRHCRKYKHIKNITWYLWTVTALLPRRTFFLFTSRKQNNLLMNYLLHVSATTDTYS